jgi:dTDP-4-amino-4,6-dideoxygalactose transaminase
MFKAYSRSFVDLKTSEILSLLGQLFTPQQATDDKQIARFEKEFARFIGTKGAVSFHNCRTAMYFALKALDFEPGSEIIMPAFTFWIDAAMVELAGYKPVLVDVDFATHNIDPEKIEPAITKKTRAIFPTHLNGLGAKMAPIMKIAKKHNLRVIEDCARSCGAKRSGKRVGTFDIGTFSFGYGKGFYTIGGGMLATDDEELLEKLRKEKESFHKYGTKELYIQVLKAALLKYLNLPYFYRYSLYPLIYKFQVEGQEKYGKRFIVQMKPYATESPEFRMRMGNFQAYLGFNQLKRIDDMNRRRKINARILIDQLKGLKQISMPYASDPDAHESIHFALWCEQKPELQAYLTREGIDVQNESAVDTSNLERFKGLAPQPCPVSEKLNDRIVFLPTHPNLTPDDMLYMADKVKAFLAGAR